MRRVTLADVSTHAGVSRSTASLVLNDSPKIPLATKDRVRAAMSELGYVYNRQAATLRNQRSMTLGLIVTEVHNPFYGELVMAVEEVAYEAGYTVLVCYSRDQSVRQDTQFQRLLERGIDGLIIQPSADTTTEHVDALRTVSGVPVVLLARHFGGDHDYVGADNVAAGEMLGKHLATRGAKTIAFLGGPGETSTSRERLAGIVRGLDLADASSIHRILSATTAAGGAEAAARLLDGGELPDAIIAYSDALASGIYGELLSRGVRPGEDVAIASFDDLPGSDHLMPPLTTAATFPQSIGAAGTALVLERIEATAGSHPSQTRVEPKLRIRASSVLWRPSHD